MPGGCPGRHRRRATADYAAGAALAWPAAVGVVWSPGGAGASVDAVRGLVEVRCWAVQSAATGKD
jgi:hypothetical protein